MRIHPRAAFGLRAFATVAGLAVLGSGLAASPAAAAKPSDPQGSNCVVTLAKGVNQVTDTSCFPTFTDAISFATHGAVTDAPAIAAQAADDVSFAAKINAAGAARASDVSAAASIIGIEYEGLNYGGAFSITFSGTTPCTGPISNVDYQYSLPQYMNGILVWDRISSFRTFYAPTYCFEDHYYLQNFGGPHTGFTSSRSPVPTMNVGGGPFTGDNNTRSIKWS